MTEPWDVFCAVAALVLFALFAGFIVIRVPSVPLGIVVVGAVAMAAIDFLQSLRNPDAGSN